MRIMLLLLLLVGVTFASCDQSCCTSNGGTWDSEYEYCDIDYGTTGYDNYISCYGNCYDDDGYSSSFDYSCCGPALLLLGIVGFAVRSS
jgi:hypothetical protein